MNSQSSYNPLKKATTVRTQDPLLTVAMPFLPPSNKVHPPVRTHSATITFALAIFKGAMQCNLLK